MKTTRTQPVCALACAVHVIVGLFATALVLPGTAQAQSTPSITNLSVSQKTVSFAWDGGAGRFLLQRSIDLSNWVNVFTSSARSTRLPMDAANSFYKVAASTTNSVFALTVLLSPDSEVPATPTSGGGVGLMSIEGNTLHYFVSFHGLSAAATAGHIHAPASPTNNSAVAIPFSVPAATAGEISGTATLTDDQVSNIITGYAYVNLHTPTYPGGEIRGQIVPLRIPLSLSGANEVSPVANGGTGEGAFYSLGNELFYEITYTNLSSPATAAHIHGPADATNNAAVMIPFANPSGLAGTISGQISLTPAQLSYFLYGKTYVNLHTQANPGGEMRQQVFPLRFFATMAGSNEVGAVNTPATGSATITIANGSLLYDVAYQNLSSAASAGHIHAPADETHNSSVVIPFSAPSGTSGSVSGSSPYTSLELRYLINGLSYVNIHTANNPGGEIRGQLYP